MKYTIITLIVLLLSCIQSGIAQVIFATMDSKIEVQAMGKYENPVMVTQNVQALNQIDTKYKYVIYLKENYMEIHKNGKYVTDSPFDSYKKINKNSYHFYSTFTPSSPYDNLVIDDVIIINSENNTFFYSWYDPIADVTITQMGQNSIVKVDKSD